MKKIPTPILVHSTVRQSIPAAFFLAIFYAFVVSGMNATAKELTESGLPVMQVVWARFAFHSLLMTPIAMFVFCRRPREFNRGQIRGHALRGLLIVLATALYFPALRDNPLADVIAVFFIFPIFVIFLAAIFLGESLRRRRIFAAVVAFSGVLIVLRPGGGAYSPTIFLSLLAGLAFAAYIAATRASSLRASPVVVAWGAATAAFLIGSPIAFLQWQPPSDEQWTMMILLGAFAAVSHWSITAACRLADASLVGLFQYSEVIAAAIVGYFIFAHIPDGWVWVGFSLIAGANIVVTLMEARGKFVGEKK